jgi:ferredoxin
MLIDPQKCVACGNCIPVCPMGAIYVDTDINRATINRDECVECGTCFRGMSQEHLNPTLVRTVRKVAKIFRFRFDPEPDVCPTSAFVMDELEWPRIARRVFSDPLVEHTSTGIKGRGTEEVKTNDVAHRVDVGEVGFVIEFGRPGTGVRFHQIQTMTRALAAIGVAFEPKNPITHLLTDKTTGDLNAELIDEKILSAIVEIKTRLEDVERVLVTVDKVSNEIDTVVAVGVSTRCDDEGEDKLLAPLLERLGYNFERAKTNMGLGRITNSGAGSGTTGEAQRDQHLAPVR